MQTTDENPREDSVPDDLMRVRREKLDALKTAGRDPYRIVTFGRTHTSADIEGGIAVNYDS